MSLQKVDLFEVRLEPVVPVQPKPFSISQLIEQFDAGLSARRYDRYSISATLEKLIARTEETTEVQRAEVMASIWEADPRRIHPGTMRRFFAAGWPEVVELFTEFMRSTDPEDLQWGLSARLALCDTALRAEKGADRRRLESAKAGLVAFATACLSNHELLVDDKAVGLRGILEMCSKGEIPENRPLEPPRAHEESKDGDENESSGRRRGKAGNPHKLPKKSRRIPFPEGKYSKGEGEASPAPPAQPAPTTPAQSDTPAPAPPAPPAPLAAAPSAPEPAPSPEPAEPVLTPPAVTDDQIWAVMIAAGELPTRREHMAKAIALRKEGRLRQDGVKELERLMALMASTRRLLEAKAAEENPFA